MHWRDRKITVLTVSNGSRKIRRSLDQVLVPKERVISTGRGCYNCKHWNREAAGPLWAIKRQHDLKVALDIALNLPDGEPKTAEDCKTPEALRCFNVKSMVNSLDHLVASGHVGVCEGGGRTANGEPVGDFTVHSLYCQVWSGVTGASLATDGHAPDVLPEERADKLNKPN